MRRVGRGARDAADRLAVEGQLRVVRRGVVAVDRKHAQPAVRVAAVVEPGDGLLAGVAALREADRAPLEAGLGRHHAVVQLTAEPGSAGQDPESLELVLADRLRAGRRVGVEQLEGRDAVVAGRKGDVELGHHELPLAQHDDRAVLLELDLAPRREPGSRELADDTFTRARLGEEQEIVRRAPPHDEGSDDARLGRQQERLAGRSYLERLDLVGDHPVQVGRGVRAVHGNVRPRARSDL